MNDEYNARYFKKKRATLKFSIILLFLLSFFYFCFNGINLYYTNNLNAWYKHIYFIFSLLISSMTIVFILFYFIFNLLIIIIKYVFVCIDDIDFKSFFKINKRKNLISEAHSITISFTISFLCTAIFCFFLSREIKSDLYILFFIIFLFLFFVSIPVMILVNHKEGNLC